MSRPRPPLLPLLATIVLLGGMVTQFILPVHTPLPEVSPSRARAVARTIAAIVPVTVSPLLTARTLFTPSRRFDPSASTATNAAGAPAADPFAGATLTGVARDRTYAVAVLREAGGVTVSIRPGGRVGDWRLVRVGTGSASFGRAGAVRTLNVGETAKVQPTAAQQSSEVTQP